MNPSLTSALCPCGNRFPATSGHDLDRDLAGTGIPAHQLEQLSAKLLITSKEPKEVAAEAIAFDGEHVLDWVIRELQIGRRRLFVSRALAFRTPRNLISRALPH